MVFGVIQQARAERTVTFRINVQPVSFAVSSLILFLCPLTVDDISELSVQPAVLPVHLRRPECRAAEEIIGHRIVRSRENPVAELDVIL